MLARVQKEAMLLLSLGHTRADVAKNLRITRSRLDYWMEQIPEVRQEYDKLMDGDAIGRLRVVLADRLLDLMYSRDDVAAALACRAVLEAGR